MSIYPVPMIEWFPKPTHQKGDYDPDVLNIYQIARLVVRIASCRKCKKKCKWNRAWAHHSVPWGNGDVWCSKKCLLKS